MTATVNTSSIDFIGVIQKLGGELVVEGLDKKAFIEFCGTYPELLTERDTKGKTIIMPPVFGGSGFRESKLNQRVSNWCEAYGKGEVGSSQIGFDLPDESTRSPDASWISAERLAQLSINDIEKRFIPAVPDFVIELRSASDRLKKLKKKMQNTWIKNGVRLAWLIDPYEEKAYIYREDGSIDIITNFDENLSGETTLPNFILKLEEFRLLGK